MCEAEKKLAAEVAGWFAQAEATDGAEDREHGDKRGDEMPDWVANKVARLERIRAAKATLEAEAKAPPPDPDDEGPGPRSGMRGRARWEAEAKAPPPHPDDEGPGPSSGMIERTPPPPRGPDGGPPDRAQRNF